LVDNPGDASGWFASPISQPVLGLAIIKRRVFIAAQSVQLFGNQGRNPAGMLAVKRERKFYELLQLSEG
jgi:hypothetical protein